MLKNISIKEKYQNTSKINDKQTDTYSSFNDSNITYK